MTTSGSEYHVNVENNRGHVIAGPNNTITTYNSYNYLKIETPVHRKKKKRTKSRDKKKSKQPEDVKSDRSEGFKNPKLAKETEVTKELSRKDVVFKGEQSCEETNNYADEGVKIQDQEYVTTSEEETVFDCREISSRHEANRAEKSNTLRQRSKKAKTSSKDGNFSKSETKTTSESGDLFSPLKLALRQGIFFSACIIVGLYFEILSFLPFFFWLIFVLNNLLACFSCIKLTFKRIEQIPTQTNNNRKLIAIASFRIDFFITEEKILQKLFALLLCVSLGFVSSQIFGCVSCVLMQTIVVTIISTFPYLVFKNNFILPFVLSEHCRIFKEGLECSSRSRKFRS